jgi:small subunit ribosomal protein S3
MGQKTSIRSASASASPRRGGRRGTPSKDMPALLKEDALLRKYLKARLDNGAIADVRIERKPGKVVVTIHTGRPGVVIGKKGAEVDKLRDELAQLTGKEVGINVEEIKRPELEAQLIADNIGAQLVAAYLVPSRAEARGAERDAHGRAGHQGEVQRSSRRRRNRARGRVP